MIKIQRRQWAPWLLALAWATSACGTAKQDAPPSPPPSSDAGAVKDGGAADSGAGQDAAVADAGSVPDTAASDTAASDTGAALDVPVPKDGTEVGDATGTSDTGPPTDATVSTDSGVADAGTPDAGTPDAGTADAGGPLTPVGCFAGKPSSALQLLNKCNSYATVFFDNVARLPLFKNGKLPPLP